MAGRLSTAFILAISLISNHHVSALQVTPGSACAAVCLDNSNDNHNDPTKSTTSPEDIVCQDTKYTTEAAGNKYQNCMQCLKSSHFVNGTESDSAWWFYNLRYTVDVCLYGYPNISSEQIVSSPCNTEYSCQPFAKALQVGILDPAKAATFDYCEADGSVFTGPKFGSCVKCLRSSSQQSYMANFMTALKGGCDQRPNPQSVLQLNSTIFSTSQVEVVDPAATTDTSQADPTSAMTTGAIAGIVIGAALLFLGGTALFWIYHRRQKRMYRLDTPTPQISYPRMGPAGMPPPFSGPATSLHSKNGSMASTFDMHMKVVPTINSQQHYRPQETGTQGIAPANIDPKTYNYDPHMAGQGPQVALPTHPAYIPHAVSRMKTTHDLPSPSPTTPFEDDYIPTPAEDDHAQIPKASQMPQYQVQALVQQQMQQVQQPLPPQIQIHPPVQSQPQLRPPEHWSLHPQISEAARARIAAYVMNDENSHPLVPGETVLQKPAAVLPAGRDRGPSPSMRNQQIPLSVQASANAVPVTGLLPNGMPLPPPPPAGARAVQLGTPSAPKLRTAKQYTPPHIAVPSKDAFAGLSPTDSTVTIGLDLGTPGLRTPGLSTPGLPTPLPPLRGQRWANESTAGVGFPPSTSTPQMAEHRYNAGGWRAQNGAMNFSNPYRSNSVNNNSDRSQDRSRRETQFEDLDTPYSGVEEAMYR